MPIAPPCSFAEWKKPLLYIGLREEHITEDLVEVLGENGFRADTIMDESFQGYFNGSTEHEAGEVVAKQFASFNDLQLFLEPIIDWVKAWDSLKAMERYILLKTDELNTWALFMLE